MQSIILIGLNHKSASVSVRECLAFNEDEARSALVELCKRKTVDEAMLFSTCNRVELLLVSSENDTAIAEAKAFLSEFKQVPLDNFNDVLYLHRGDEAVRHVFRVAASLDSMVVGEPQILGQIKSAYRTATEEKTSGVILNRLLHRTFFVAKRIRSDTGIGDRLGLAKRTLPVEGTRNIGKADKTVSFVSRRHAQRQLIAHRARQLLKAQVLQRLQPER